jgi:hypothetical protein
MTTEWAPYTSPSGAPSGLQCVTTWRGPEAGTGSLGVFWAGTDGTLWRSSTDPHSDFVQMQTDATTVTRIGVDDRETIYGINSSGKPVQFGNESWVSVDLGPGSAEYVMVDVAVALDDTAWYVAQGGQYYVHETSTTIEKELMLSLKAIAPMKAPDSSDPSSEGEAWGVIKWGGGAGQLAYNPWQWLGVHQQDQRRCRCVNVGGLRVATQRRWVGLGDHRRLFRRTRRLRLHGQEHLRGPRQLLFCRRHRRQAVPHDQPHSSGLVPAASTVPRALSSTPRHRAKPATVA